MFRVHYLLKVAGSAPTADAVRSLFPGVAGCLFCPAIAEAPPGWPPPMHGAVLDLWFHTEDEANAAATADISSLLSDGAELTGVFVGMERVVMRMPDFFTRPAIKGVYLFSRKDGMAISDFLHHWWHTHGPIAALTEAALCYIQSHATAAEGNLCDGITELYWPDAEAAARGITSEQMRVDQANDAPNFVADGSVSLFLAEQQVVIKP